MLKFVLEVTELTEAERNELYAVLLVSLMGKDYSDRVYFEVVKSE